MLVLFLGVKKLKRPLTGFRTRYSLFQPQNGRLQEWETSPAAPLNFRGDLSAMRKTCSDDLFLVLVPQGLELLLALVLGDFLTPFFLEIAHDDTTFVLFS